MDKILYELVANGGGVDGRDHTDKGGQIVAASWSRCDMETHKGAPWCHIRTSVVDPEKVKRAAMAKLSAVDRLALGL